MGNKNKEKVLPQVKELKSLKLNQYTATRGRRQGPTTIPGFDKGTSIEQEKRLDFQHCHKYHFGTCRRITGGCFRCGSIDHLIVNCSRGSGSSRNPQGSSRGGPNVPPPTRDRGRGRGSSGQHRRSIALETVNRPNTIVPARAYDMRTHGDQDELGVIVGILSLYDIEMHALVDLGSTHSYVCAEHLFDKMPLVEQLAYDMHVTSPIGHSVGSTECIRIVL